MKKSTMEPAKVHLNSVMETIRNQSFSHEKLDRYRVFEGILET